MCRFAVQQFRSSRSTRFCAEGWQRGLRKPAADQSSLLSAEPHLLGSARWLQHGSAPPEGHRSPSSPATGPGGPLPGSALPLPLASIGTKPRAKTRRWRTPRGSPRMCSRARGWKGPLGPAASTTTILPPARLHVNIGAAPGGGSPLLTARNRPPF